MKKYCHQSLKNPCMDKELALGTDNPQRHCPGVHGFVYSKGLLVGNIFLLDQFPIKLVQHALVSYH